MDLLESGAPVVHCPLLPLQYHLGPRALSFSLTSALSSAKIRIASIGLWESSANREQTVSSLSQNCCLSCLDLLPRSSISIESSLTVADRWRGYPTRCH